MQACRYTFVLVLVLVLGRTSSAEPPNSALFPHCWGGRGNDAVYYTEGLTLRQLVLYSNPNKAEPLTHVRLVMDYPAGAVEPVMAVMCDGYRRVKTEMTRETVTRDGQAAVRLTCPMWDIKPGFTWKGKTPWSEWPGWWSARYVKGKTRGRYAARWHLESDRGNEPENTAPLVVLPRPARSSLNAGPPAGAGVGVWCYTLSNYGDWPEVVNGLAESLAACGVQRAYVASKSLGSIKALKAQGIEVDLTNPWPYSAFAPAPPPDEARAVNEKGEKIPGNSWCPAYVAERGPAWEKAVRPLVTDAIRAAGADGFMLDYEGTAAEGYNACNICFCFRCQAAFAKALGDEQCALDWPKDVRPDGKFHEKWLTFRCVQGALYVKNVADLAREGNPKARTYTWSGGYYKPYPSHVIYSQACSDITKFAPHLTAPTVGTYVYPNDPAKALDADPAFGKDPKCWGRSIPDMIAVIRWTAEVLKPQPIIPCVSGGHTPGGSATPLASTDLLRQQIGEHVRDGVRGVDFWGTGPLEDGRYLALIAELAERLSKAQPK